MIPIILGEMNSFSLYLFDNAFVYWKRIIVGEAVYPKRLISC